MCVMNLISLPLLLSHLRKILHFRADDVPATVAADERPRSKLTPATQNDLQVIHNTFTPLLAGTGVSIPEDLAPRLLHRFATMEGYTLESPDLVAALRSLKRPAATPSGGRGSLLYDQIVIGVVTNSDDRVPGILASAGFAVSPLRYAMEEATDPAAADRGNDRKYDIDFHCMSYDVGVEKPDRAIFEAADYMLQRVLAARQRSTTSTTTTTNTTNTTSAPVLQGDGGGDQQAWQKIYVGDEYAKDVVGSLGAGWNSVLLDHQESGSSSTHEGQIIPKLKGAGQETASIADMFAASPVVSVHNIQDLIRCLRGQC